MSKPWIQIVLTCLACAPVSRGEGVDSRPALDANPVAVCRLQELPARVNSTTTRQQVVGGTLLPLPADSLEYYERTPFGDWRMPASVERGDPWLRLLLLAPKRPIVIDVAVLINGRPFRESREAWIDGLLQHDDGRQASLPEGTELSDDPSKSESSVDRSSGVVEKADAEGSPLSGDSRESGSTSSAVATQTRAIPTMDMRLTSYLSANGSNVDRDEVRWLIAEWGSGPPVLLLGPSLSWQRATLAPLLTYLDRDADGMLSAAEIGAATAALQAVDMNADDVVDDGELRRASNRPAAVSFATGHSALVEIDEQTDWIALSATIGRVYGNELGDGWNSPQQICALTNRPADITLRIDFGTADNGATGVRVLSIGREIGESAKVVTASSDVVTTDLGVDYLEFSAAQQETESNSEIENTQVAIGAAVDGNPLMRRLDLDGDQRLTMRERQNLAGVLTALDRDGDGAVGSAEVPLPVRFAVTLGPHVHRLLAVPVGVGRAVALHETSSAPPAWFAGMDKNRDHDLSRKEFLGTPQQFERIDADGDGLVSVDEALKLAPGQ